METFVIMLFRMLLMIVLIVMPIAAVVFFIISLTRFLKTDKEDTQLRKENKTYLIIASCIMGFVVLAIVAIVVFMILVMIGLSHM